MGDPKTISWDIPSEVMWVAAIQYSGQPVGQKTYDQCQEIIDKYPQYFEWEHKYKKVPHEVHEAFKDECYPDRHKPIEWKTDESFEGYIPAILKSNQEHADQRQSTFTIQDLKDFFTRMDNLEKERRDEERRIQNIWHKHYAKYDLEYRK